MTSRPCFPRWSVTNTGWFINEHFKASRLSRRYTEGRTVMDETSLYLVKCPISHPQAANRFTCERAERARPGGGGGGEREDLTSYSPLFSPLACVIYKKATFRQLSLYDCTFRGTAILEPKELTFSSFFFFEQHRKRETSACRPGVRKSLRFTSIFQ